MVDLRAPRTKLRLFPRQGFPHEQRHDPAPGSRRRTRRFRPPRRRPPPLLPHGRHVHPPVALLLRARHLLHLRPRQLPRLGAEGLADDRQPAPRRRVQLPDVRRALLERDLAARRPRLARPGPRREERPGGRPVPHRPRDGGGARRDAARLLSADLRLLPLLPAADHAAVALPGEQPGLGEVRTAHVGRRLDGPALRLPPSARALPGPVAGRRRRRARLGRLRARLHGVLLGDGDGGGAGPVLRDPVGRLGAAAAALDAARGALRALDPRDAVPRPPPVGAPRAALLPDRAGGGLVLRRARRPPRRAGPLPQPAVLVGVRPALPPARPRLPRALVSGRRPRARHDDAEPALVVGAAHDQRADPQEVVRRRVVPLRPDALLLLPRHLLLRLVRDLALGRHRADSPHGLQPAVLLGDGDDLRERHARRRALGRLPRLHAHPALHGPHLLQGRLRPRAAAARRVRRAGPLPARARGGLAGRLRRGLVALRLPPDAGGAPRALRRRGRHRHARRLVRALRRPAPRPPREGRRPRVRREARARRGRRRRRTWPLRTRSRSSPPASC